MVTLAVLGGEIAALRLGDRLVGWLTGGGATGLGAGVDAAAVMG